MNLKQPKALYLLYVIQLCECFSFYGMRTILILFMIDKLGYDDMRSFGTYAIFISLAEAGGIVGGHLADKIFGLKYAVHLGLYILATGHICVAIPNNEIAFYLGLGLIIVGASLFRSNCTSLLGEFYTHNDPRRDAGFTTFYVGINIGFLFSSIACTYVGQIYGWHAGFGLAAFGILIAIIILFRFDYILENKGKIPIINKFRVIVASVSCVAVAPIFSMMVYLQNVFINIIPLLGMVCVIYVFKKIRDCTKREKRNIYIILTALAMLVVFFACAEQIGSTLILFSERNVTTVIFGYDIPAAALTTMQPLAIVILGPILSRIISIKERRLHALRPFSKMNFGLLFLGLSFLVLYLGCRFADQNYSVNVNYVMLALVIMALAEIVLAPTVDVLCTDLSPYHLRGMMMGVVYMGYAFANLFSGYLSQTMAVNVQDSKDLSLKIYNQGFFNISIGCFAISFFIIILMILRRKFLTKS